MVAYGSDYLLGLVDLRARGVRRARPRASPRATLAFLARNDALQHLGNVGFRAPVPAYKHAAAMYLHLTGGLDHDTIHPRAPASSDPDADRVAARRLRALASSSPVLGDARLDRPDASRATRCIV